MQSIISKLPNVQTSIFTVMSRLARKHEAINLSQGFPNFDCDERLKSLVFDYMKKGYNQYAPMAGIFELRNQLAMINESLYGRSFDPEEEITITAGATQAIYTAISAFVQAGDEVILIEPAYDSYKPSIEVNGGIVIPYGLTLPSFKVDWDAFAQLITDKTRMIVINTPHNPTASVFDEEDMKALERITKGTNIVVLCDEVYAFLVYDGQKHQSVLNFPDLYARSLATYSFGKTFHNTGWKMGYCMGPAHLMREFRKVHEFNVFSVNTPVQYAISDYIKDRETLFGLSAFFQQKRDLFGQLMEGSKFRLLPAHGTYFQLADYSAISEENDVDFAKRMTKEFGVAAIPISVFYSNLKDEKLLRFCFAKTDELLQQAAAKLIQI